MLNGAKAPDQKKISSVVFFILLSDACDACIRSSSSPPSLNKFSDPHAPFPIPVNIIPKPSPRSSRNQGPNFIYVRHKDGNGYFTLPRGKLISGTISSRIIVKEDMDFCWWNPRMGRVSFGWPLFMGLPLLLWEERKRSQRAGWVGNTARIYCGGLGLGSG